MGTRAVTAVSTGSRATSVDPDFELIDDIVVTPANVADGEVAAELLGDREGGAAEERPLVFGDSAYAAPDTIAAWVRPVTR
jgi:hypothetical protein